MDSASREGVHFALPMQRICGFFPNISSIGHSLTTWILFSV